MSEPASPSPDSTQTRAESLSKLLGLRPGYPYLDDFLVTGRLRNPETGRFVAPCPSYPEHPAPCHYSIGSHFGCLWPDYGLPMEEAIAFFDATEKPWSDPRARKIVFGEVDGIYFP